MPSGQNLRSAHENQVGQLQCKPPSVRRLNALAGMSAGGEYGRFQAACRRSDLVAGWAARFAAAQLAVYRARLGAGNGTTGEKLQ